SEYKAFNVSFLTPDAVKSVPEVTEEDIAAYYEQYKQFFVNDAGEAEPLEAVKPRIIEELKVNKKGDALMAVATKMDDLLAGGATLKEAAEELGFTTQSVAMVNVEG